MDVLAGDTRVRIAIERCFGVKILLNLQQRGARPDAAAGKPMHAKDEGGR
jgi:hypothetical protein